MWMYKRFTEMNWDEKFEELLKDYDTQIPNERGYWLSVRSATQIHLDMIPLTENLDLFRSYARVPLMWRLAQTLHEESPGNVFFWRDAIFKAEADSGADAHALLQRVNRRLAQAVITLRTRTGKLAIFEGFGFSYGIGINADDAEDALYQRERGWTRTATHYLHKTPDCLPQVFEIMEHYGRFLSFHVPPRHWSQRSAKA